MSLNDIENKVCNLYNTLDSLSYNIYKPSFCNNIENFKILKSTIDTTGTTSTTGITGITGITGTTSTINITDTTGISNEILNSINNYTIIISNNCEVMTNFMNKIILYNNILREILSKNTSAKQLLNQLNNLITIQNNNNNIINSIINILSRSNLNNRIDIIAILTTFNNTYTDMLNIINFFNTVNSFNSTLSLPNNTSTSNATVATAETAATVATPTDSLNVRINLYLQQVLPYIRALEIISQENMDYIELIIQKFPDLQKIIFSELNLNPITQDDIIRLESEAKIAIQTVQNTNIIPLP
jgi:hypothetical protein